MNKEFVVNFDTQSIKSAIDFLQVIANEFDKLPKELAKEVANDGLSYLNQEYASIPPEYNIRPITTRVEEQPDGYNIVAEGQDVIYLEFGTGEIGKESNYDPIERAKYQLNDYNSGPIVSKNINDQGRHYWYYNGYTEGIPAGKQFYNMRNHIIDNIKDKERKLVGDILSKL